MIPFLEFRKQVLRELSVMRATINQNRDTLQVILAMVSKKYEQTPCHNEEIAPSTIPKNLPLLTMEELKKLEEDLIDEPAQNSMVSLLFMLMPIFPRIRFICANEKHAILFKLKMNCM